MGPRAEAMICLACSNVSSTSIANTGGTHKPATKKDTRKDDSEVSGEDCEG